MPVSASPRWNKTLYAFFHRSRSHLCWLFQSPREETTHWVDRWTSIKPNTECCTIDETSSQVTCNTHQAPSATQHNASTLLTWDYHVLKSGHPIYPVWQGLYLEPTIRISPWQGPLSWGQLSMAWVATLPSFTQSDTAQDGKTDTEERIMWLSQLYMDTQVYVSWKICFSSFWLKPWGGIVKSKP